MSKTLSLKTPLPIVATIPIPGTPDVVGVLTDATIREVVKALDEALVPTEGRVFDASGLSREELLALLAQLPDGQGFVDSTMDLPVESGPKATIDPYAAKGGAVQIPPAAHGQFGIDGIPLMRPQVNLGETINPATGEPYIQIGMQRSHQISPPPSRRFDGR